MPVFRESDLRQLVCEILQAEKVDDWSVACVTDSLVSASLRGVDTHGVRLLPTYIKSLRGGSISRNPTITCRRPFPAKCVVDADHAFGIAAGYRAIDECIAAARQTGIAVASVFNSDHPGCMASFTLRAARQGFLAMAFTNTGSKILSHSGTRPYFGTNPIAFAAPRKEEDPLCLDMATSIIPWNRVEQSMKTGQRLPAGTCADKNGQETQEAKSVQSLLPIGSYKGFGLAAMVEVMSCSLSGMSFGQHTLQMYGPTSDPSQRRCLGQAYVVMRCDGCISEEEFRDGLQQMTDEVRAEPSVEGEQVMMPGDPEICCSQQRAKEGIPVQEGVWSELVTLATGLGVALPNPLSFK